MNSTRNNHPEATYGCRMLGYDVHFYEMPSGIWKAAAHHQKTDDRVECLDADIDKVEYDIQMAIRERLGEKTPPSRLLLAN